MMLRAIVIDDEQMGIDSLKRVIGEFISDVKVVAESTHAAAAIELVENYKPEIVFLDINMPGMTGFDLLEKLTWKNFHLVFVTAHQEYALRALKNNAMDYLLKPIDDNELQATIDKIKSKIAAHETASPFVQFADLVNDLNPNGGRNKILVNLKTGIEPVELGNIVYMESRSNYTQIHLTDLNAYLIPKTLREFEEQLRITHPNFMRVHHSFLINIHKVTRYERSGDVIVMVNNKRIPLSKSKRDVFLTWLEI